CGNGPWTCGPTTTARARSPSSCRPSSPTCWSTASRASPSAWPPTSRRITSATSSKRRWSCTTNPRPRPPPLPNGARAPGSPPGGKVVTDRATLRQIYEEGTGSIKVQGEWKLEEQGRRRQIVITSIPYGVNKGQLENTIGAIIESRKLPQLTGLTNESNLKDG